MTLRVLIVEDEPPARALLARMLRDVPDVEVAGEAGDADAAVRAIAALGPDVVMLDIQLPGGDGFSVLDRLDETAPTPAIVFVTAHDRYAVDAFDRHAVDYLLKPFDEERLTRALARVRARRAAEPERDALARALALVAEMAPGRARLALRDGDRTLLVRLGEIESVEAAGKHVVVRGAGGGEHTARESLGAVERRLDARFVRVHRSVIVNLDHVREIRPFFAGDQELVLSSGRTVTTGRGFRDRLRARL